MKKLAFILSLFIFPLIGFSQDDNVKVNNKKPKPNPKEGAMNNSAIRKSKKAMGKSGNKFDNSKYSVPAKSKGQKEKGGDKKEDKKPPVKKSDKAKM
jgi:hypothetical protein